MSNSYNQQPIVITTVMGAGWKSLQTLNSTNQPVTAQNVGVTIPSQFGINVYKVIWDNPTTAGHTFTIVDPQNSNVLLAGTAGVANQDVEYDFESAPANWRDFKVTTISSGTLYIFYRS